MILIVSGFALFGIWILYMVIVYFKRKKIKDADEKEFG
jgi:hypothetical protein